MSKHPIPDWLRSQFSRIEDEVRKLGPCGVFTQMRTVTQTYFEQQVAAPQPPALGDDLDDALRDMASVACQSALSHGIGEHEFLKLARGVRQLVEAPLQAEIERLKDNVSEVTTYRDNAIKKIERLRNELTGTEKERDQIKARCDALEKDREALKYLMGQFDSEVCVCDRCGDEKGLSDFDSAEYLRDYLSKPAGSERVCHLCRGEGRVGGPAPDEGGGKNCVLCDGTGMAVQP